jgi:hypothetical protein
MFDAVGLNSQEGQGLGAWERGNKHSERRK